MAYKRRTVDVWHLEVNYGYGWEHECTEMSWKDAKAQAKTYRENISYPVRLLKKRERLEEPHA
jgi:hypothetical protein